MEEELKNLEEQMRSLTLLFSSPNIAERQRASTEILRLKVKHDKLAELMAEEKWKDEDKNLPPGWDMKDFKTIEIPPEHKVSLGATFQYLGDVAKKEEELEKLEEQIEKLQEFLENAEDFDDVNMGHMELDELRIKHNNLKESMSIQAPPQSVYNKDYTEQLMKDFEELKREYISALPKALASPSKDHAEQLKKDFEKRKKEYDNAFLQGLTPEQLKKNLDRAIKGDFQDDWQRKTERKRKGILERLDWKSEKEEDESRAQPSNDVAGVYLPSEYGADIEAEQVFQQELHGIVDEMKVKLVNEKKILEGTLNPEYGKGDWGLPHIERTITENELSQSKPTEEQWKSDSPNGSLITDPIHISTTESNNSACIAELFNRDCPIAQSDDKSTPSSTDSCSGRLDDCGTETGVTNESSECTVPMISAAMLGMPSEVRWSPPRRSIVSSGQTLLDVKS